MIIPVMSILRSCHIVLLTVTVLNIYGHSIPVVIPLTSPRIAVNSRLNLLYCLQDAIGPSQLPSWINAGASLETKDNCVKASTKVTTVVLVKAKLTLHYWVNLLLKLLPTMLI